ncbi:MAG: NrfD/PsrC family molybdoenzyme membrane anchor subunit [Janthinobacterium lividum]
MSFPAVPAGETFGSLTGRIGTPPLHFPAPRGWGIAFGVALLLLASFVVSTTVLFLDGVGVWGENIPVDWAFDILAYTWWVGIAHAGTLISALLLLLGQEWRNALNRMAEAMTVFAVFCAGLYPIVHLGRPWFAYWMIPYPSTLGVYPQFRSPLGWDMWAVLTYLTVSILFFYVGLIPDLATMRDKATSPRAKTVYGVAALGWRGSAMHWVRWRRLYRLMAMIAVPLVVSVSSEVSLLLAAGQIPGWHSTIFPVYFVIGAIFSGFSLVTMIAVVVRRMLGVERLVTDAHLDYLSRLLLVTGLMTAYCYIFEAFDQLWSGNRFEVGAFWDRLVGPYAWSYWAALFLNFVPLQGLWFQRVRTSHFWLFVIGLSGLSGMWVERFMLLITGLYRNFLPSLEGRFTPTVWDWGLFLGTLGVFLVPLLLFLRFLPAISMSEEKEVVG